MESENQYQKRKMRRIYEADYFAKKNVALFRDLPRSFNESMNKLSEEEMTRHLNLKEIISLWLIRLENRRTPFFYSEDCIQTFDIIHELNPVYDKLRWPTTFEGVWTNQAYQVKEKEGRRFLTMYESVDSIVSKKERQQSHSFVKELMPNWYSHYKYFNGVEGPTFDITDLPPPREIGHILFNTDNYHPISEIYECNRDLGEYFFIRPFEALPSIFQRKAGIAIPTKEMGICPIALSHHSCLPVESDNSCARTWEEDYWENKACASFLFYSPIEAQSLGIELQSEEFKKWAEDISLFWR